jgi:hypothetical protein
MKTLLSTILILFTATMLAQDIVDVDALPPGNINNVINGDTIAGGLRANPDRIYRLQRGFVYQVTAPMHINGNLNIIATDGTDRPPVLAPAILPDGSSPDYFFWFIGKGAKINLNDIYLHSFRADGAQLGWSTGMGLGSDSMELKLRGVIFDGWSSTGIRIDAHWNKIDVQDCHFRNLQHGSAWFGGQPYLTGSPVHMDTVIFRNNTFFACNSYLWSIRGYDVHSVFEHNTVAYTAVNPFLIRQGSNLHINNNLFYGVHAMGGNPTHVIDGWFLNYPDTASSSIIRVRGLDSVSYWSKLWNSTIAGPNAYIDSARGVTAETVNPSNRVFEVQNNAYFWPQKYYDFLKSYNDTVETVDSIGAPVYGDDYQPGFAFKRVLRAPTWISDYAQWTIDSLFPAVGTQSTVAGNLNTDPGFNPTVANHMDKLNEYILKITTNKLDVPWFFDPNNSVYPPAWPLPEDLRYTNSALMSAGTDGLPLGDLNWFPELVGVQTKDNIPIKYELSDAYPNPFNPETKIDFMISKSANVKLSIFNILGQKVKTLVNQEMNPGTYSATWNGKDESGNQVSSGVYLYSLETESFKTTKKVMLMK